MQFGEHKFRQQLKSCPSGGQKPGVLKTKRRARVCCVQRTLILVGSGRGILAERRCLLRLSGSKCLILWQVARVPALESSECLRLGPWAHGSAAFMASWLHLKAGVVGSRGPKGHLTEMALLHVTFHGACVETPIHLAVQEAPDLQSIPAATMRARVGEGHSFTLTVHAFCPGCRRPPERGQVSGETAENPAFWVGVKGYIYVRPSPHSLEL